MANMARIAQLYQEQAPEQTGPGEHESAFLASSHRPGAEDIRRAALFQALFSKPGDDSFKPVEVVKALQDNHDQGLAEARAGIAVCEFRKQVVIRAAAIVMHAKERQLTDRNPRRGYGRDYADQPSTPR